MVTDDGDNFMNEMVAGEYTECGWEGSVEELVLFILIESM